VPDRDANPGAQPGTDARSIAIIDEAMDLPEEEREAFVRERCAGDPNVRDRVLAALAGAAARPWLEELVDTVFTADDDPSSDLARYRLGDQIGRGSMGFVYKAHDTLLDRPVAVKFVWPHGELGGERDHPALREARTSSNLEHPAIVPVYDVGVTNGRCWFVSAYVESVTLRKMLLAGADDDAYRRSEAWVYQATVYAIECAYGLAHAHGRGVIHRDVTPSNILIDADGKPRLIDFGVALLTGDPHLGADVVGTLEYLSPERAAAVPAPPSPADDVFALAVTLYECLAAKRPHTARTLPEIREALKKPPTPIRTLNPAAPRGLERVLARALSPDRADRYDDARALAADLERALDGAPLERDGRLARWGYALRRRWGTLALLAAGLALILALVAALLPAPTTGVLEVRAPGGAPVTVSPIGGPAAGPLAPAHRGTGPGRLTLEAGLYRVEIADGELTRELTRRVPAGGEVAVAAPALGAGVPSDTVLIPAGSAVVGIAGDLPDGLRRRTVELPAFLIDRREVTHAEFRRYVLATGASSPSAWAEGYDEALADHPVTGVTLAQARGYAEWAGKRLPTHVEWERAAAGAEGRAYPWGDAAPPPPSAGAVAVIADPGVDITPEGVERLFGNVSEWTESVSPLDFFGDDSPRFIVKGADATQTTAPARGMSGVLTQSPDQGHEMVGFRCASSVW